MNAQQFHQFCMLQGLIEYQAQQQQQQAAGPSNFNAVPVPLLPNPLAPLNAQFAPPLQFFPPNQNSSGNQIHFAPLGFPPGVAPPLTPLHGYFQRLTIISNEISILQNKCREIPNLEEQIKHLEKEAKEKSEEVENLRNELESEKNKNREVHRLQADEIEKLRNDLTLERLENQTLEKANEELLRDKAQHDELIKKKKKESDELKKDLDSEKTITKNFRGSMRLARKINDGLNEKIEELKLDVQSRDSSIRNLNRKLESEKKINEFTEENSEAKNKKLAEKLKKAQSEVKRTKQSQNFHQNVNHEDNDRLENNSFAEKTEKKLLGKKERKPHGLKKENWHIEKEELAEIVQNSKNHKKDIRKMRNEVSKTARPFGQTVVAENKKDGSNKGDVPVTGRGNENAQPGTLPASVVQIVQVRAAALHSSPRIPTSASQTEQLMKINEEPPAKRARNQDGL